MIVKDKTNPKIEEHKARLGLTGDVYVVDDHFIENLESHKKLMPISNAITIEEAEQERLVLIAEEKALLEEMAKDNELINDNINNEEVNKNGSIY